jgi:hypothetical protein
MGQRIPQGRRGRLGIGLAAAVLLGSGGTEPEPVSGSGGVADGGTYCTGGYSTGQNCSAVVEAIDVCVDVGDGATGATEDVCDLDEAYSSNDTPIIQPGDSGGPVYTSNSTDPRGPARSRRPRVGQLVSTGTYLEATAGIA